MRSFTCAVCGQLVFFENSNCLRCGGGLGYLPSRRAVLSLDLLPDRRGWTIPAVGDGLVWKRCANAVSTGCNWLVPVGLPDPLCLSCGLTRTRPNDADTVGMAGFAAAEAAKRRLVDQLLVLGLPVVGKSVDPTGGLCFDLLSSHAQPVMTGHEDGVITLDLSESDRLHREQVRLQLDEPYRTVLGHFRHESGHYYQDVLVGRRVDASDNGIGDGTCAAEKRRFDVFGDDTADYQAAVNRHYAEGPPAGWRSSFVSAYATMHPFEDFAETFAHYLHIRDALETAAAFGVRVDGPKYFAGAFVSAPADDEPGTLDRSDIDTVIDEWLPLTIALNSLNRSMGHDDYYPFVLAPKVIAKLGLVHDLVRGAV